MNNKNITYPNILAIGHTSKVMITGLSVAFETLLGGLSDNLINYHVLDAGEGTSKKANGVFTIKRVFYVFLLILKFVWYLPRYKVIYMTMGDSKLGFMRDFFIINLSFLFKRRIVLHLHGGGYKDFYLNSSPWLQAIIRTTLTRANTIIVLGEMLRDQFSFLECDKKNKIKVVANGLPYQLSVPRPVKTLPNQKDVIRLVYLSNMIGSKGYLKLIEACRILKGRGDINFTCEFAGEFVNTHGEGDNLDVDNAYDYFVQLIKTYKLDNIIKYHGVVTGKEKHELLSKGHIFILPTEYSGEGQPISIIEALSYAMPVISTKYRGIPEQIEDGINGVLLEENQPIKLANAIESLLKTPAEYEKMSANALNTFNNKFTRDKYINRLIPVILNKNIT